MDEDFEGGGSGKECGNIIFVMVSSSSEEEREFRRGEGESNK